MVSRVLEYIGQTIRSSSLARVIKFHMPLIPIELKGSLSQGIINRARGEGVRVLLWRVPFSLIWSVVLARA